MTSRTTPVGILVLALAGLVTVGCNAQTSAVFEALLDPGTATAATLEADPAADATAAGVASGGPWSLPDGYRMNLPPGWAGVAMDRAGTNRMMGAMASSNASLAERMQSVLSINSTRMSAIAGEHGSAGELAPMLLVLAQPLDGRKPHETKQHVKRQIAQLPGVAATPLPAKDAGLPVSRGWRFDYSIDDPDLGVLIVRSYLFRFGPDAFLVNFVAPEALADDADVIFDQIAQSLRFGI